MKALLFFIIIIVIYSNSILSQGWECQECPKRDLAFFQFDIWQREPPTPGSGLDQADWLQMLMVADGVLHALFNKILAVSVLTFTTDKWF